MRRMIISSKILLIKKLSSVPILKQNILAPILKPKQNIICMGLNYEDHIKESEKVFSKDIKNQNIQ